MSFPADDSAPVERPYDTTGLDHVGRLPVSSVRRPITVPLDGEWRFHLPPSDGALPEGTRGR
ncbi:hypothetical protein [Allonocardiopsis opalescens]|uniref:Beta-galactosidase n=1 Tax=Allonocardiopsis opalescens TaxID=1144618 RepID=A0A2T0QF29_9ACTN|nr:hypothetical protein [Allonocardiopsis opalescens]PRY02546.1 hypothetical protein CLV72_1011148 [Allonocardiopsis opalescens]